MQIVNIDGYIKIIKFKLTITNMGCINSKTKFSSKLHTNETDKSHKIKNKTRPSQATL